MERTTFTYKHKVTGELIKVTEINNRRAIRKLQSIDKEKFTPFNYTLFDVDNRWTREIEKKQFKNIHENPELLK